MSRKGQFILFAAILIVLSIISLRAIILSSQSLPSSKIYHLNKVLSNVEREYRNVVSIAAMQDDVNASLVLFLSNFSNELREELDCEILWIGIYGNNTQLAVNLGNFLHSVISVNLTFSGASPTSTSFSLKDKEVKSLKLNVQQEDVKIVLSYELRNEKRKEEISINASRAFAFGMFDIKIKTQDAEVRNIVTKDIPL